MCTLRVTALQAARTRGLRVPMHLPSVMAVLLLGGALAMPVAHAAADAPLRQEAARALRVPGREALSGQQPEDAPGHGAASATEPETGAWGEAHPEGARGPEATSTPEPSDDKAPPKPGASGRGGTRLPGMSGVPAEAGSDDVPLTAGAWVAHGGLVLLPLGGAFGASLVGGDTRPGAIAAEMAAGMLLGSQPAKLLFIRPAAPSRARWMELEVASFGAGLVLTPPLAALGTWGLGELALGGSRDRGDAYLGALGGAAAGALLGVAAHALLTKLAGPSSRLETERGLIALGFIGAGATAGYQWAGGGPRPR